MSRARRWLIGLIVALGIVAGIQACGKVSGTQWAVGWSYSWESRGIDKPVSRDGRYAYFTIQKYIGPTGDRWGKKWLSPMLRGRVDLVTGQVDTGPVPAGMKLFGGYRGYAISEAVNAAIWSDSVLGESVNEHETRLHGYGDGRFLLFIRRPNYDPAHLVAFLFDNQDTYRVIGTGFRDGWISTDENSVILVKQDNGDTWIYNIAERRLKAIQKGDALPLYYRSLKDLPVEAQQRATEAMRVIPPDAVYDHYPTEEEHI